MNYKKLQFQIDSNKAKLINYNETLTTLIQSRTRLEDSIIIENPNRDTQNQLLLQKLTLESNIKQVKQTVNSLVNALQQSNTENTSLIPLSNSRIENETNVYNDELYRITEKIKEANTIYKTSITNSRIDKLQLFKDIELLKNSCQNQTETIVKLQLNAHSSRKQVLQELRIKKQEKIIFYESINNIKVSEEFISNKIVLSDSDINNLNELKTIVIDMEYSKLQSDILQSDILQSDILQSDILQSDILQSSNPLYPTKLIFHLLSLCFTDMNLDTFIYLPFTDKISLIDNKLIDSHSRIQSISKKLDKNKLSNAARMQCIIATYNKISNRVKVIGYKDQFKLEKDKRNELESILEDMSNKYSTFDDTVDTSIKSVLDKAIYETTFDNTRAKNRLDTMKQRIIDDLSNDSLRVNNTIIQLTSELRNARILFDTTTKAIQIIKDLIIKEDIVGSEIEKINENIKLYEKMIIQTETDTCRLIERLNIIE